MLLVGCGADLGVDSQVWCRAVEFCSQLMIALFKLTADLLLLTVPAKKFWKSFLINLSKTTKLRDLKYSAENPVYLLHQRIVHVGGVGLKPASIDTSLLDAT